MAASVDYSSAALGNDHLERTFENELRRLRSSPSPVEPHLVGHKDIHAGELIERFDPCAPGSRVGAAHEAGVEVVDEAVAEATAAFKGWKATPYGERVGRLRAAAAVIGTHIGELAAIVSADRSASKTNRSCSRCANVTPSGAARRISASAVSVTYARTSRRVTRVRRVGSRRPATC